MAPPRAPPPSHDCGLFQGILETFSGLVALGSLVEAQAPSTKETAGMRRSLIKDFIANLNGHFAHLGNDIRHSRMGIRRDHFDLADEFLAAIDH